MKFLDTGATGFIGSYIVKELHEKGEDFIVLTFSARSRIVEKFMEKSNWIQGDIRNEKEVERVVSEYRPEVVINMAGLLMFGCMKYPAVRSR